MTEFPKSYDSKAAEEKWYDLWVREGFFKPEINPAGTPYSIVIPPPNVTGSLHMGHALNATLQDILIRWRRMLGDKALWLPGTDHAGIATQNVVERMLEAEGLDRHTLGRDAFVRRVWEWKKEYGGRITHQLKRMGASCDWSRERFTLDEGLSAAVREVFVRLYEEGLIYRATRLINWCPRCLTALSDLEVEHEDMEGALTYIKYPVNGADGYITVATTRPETMFGDTAVAVNPDDERYKDLIGKSLSLPLTGRVIPIIADSGVDPAFGTGAVKVTPAHDFNDEAMAKRHGLPSIAVIGDDGKMSRLAGLKYAGLDRYEARRLAVDELKTQGLIEKIEAYRHSVGHCYRCKSIIEPLSTPQWYVKIQPLAEPAIEAVRQGRIRILPEGWANSYYAWMENIKDWCISRQIWWGHRIPVWYCGDCKEVNVLREAPTACRKCGGKNLRQDEDVLDTWFSSALWPFSTLGWPSETEDLKTFYPTGVLVTAFDILFFWVARMIMMGLKFMGEVPFRDVYIHAIVRDAEGQKMSKSKGNVIDPLIIIDKYGTDAFRFTLAAFAAQGRDIKFSVERVEGYRHFINKLWNATRFIMMGAANPTENDTKGDVVPLSGRWILSRLSDTVSEVNRALEEYRFNDAAGGIYRFVWHEFCDWYIELSKTETSSEETKKCLMTSLETALLLLHPFMPFLTEEIWQNLKGRKGQSIMTAPYPAPGGIRRDLDAEAEMSYIMDTVTGIRNIRGELNISPSLELKAVIKTSSDEAERVIRENLHYVRRLARAGEITLGRDVGKPRGSATSVRAGLEVYVPLEGVLDVKKELARLNKEKQKVEESVLFIRKKLMNEDFVRKAPEDIIAKERQRLEDLLEKNERLAESIKGISGLEV
ncbi:MAG: valine--tRNA ligase [Thermodesulfovibrionales bacterium]|nr:valine--tRNA ligase [Thermodesulfovibrionales bacterium]